MLSGCTSENFANDQECVSSLEKLDKAIENYNVVKQNDKSETDSLRKELDDATREGRADNTFKSGIYHRLFEKYLYTNADSALKYAKLEIEYARDTVGRSVGHYDLAKAYITKGHDTDAYESLIKTFADTGNISVKPHYYELMIFRKNMLGENPVRWFRRLKLISAEGSESMIISRAVLSGLEGNPEEGIKIIQKHSLHEGNPRFMAVANLTKGRLQLQAGDTVGAINSLADAACLDIEIPTYRYRALSELASVLARTNDYRRAYNYIHFANDQINSSDIVGDITAVNGIMSQVVKTYDSYQQQQHRRRIMLICILSLVSTLLVISFFAIQFAYKKTRKAQENLRAINDKLTDANSNLTETYARIKEIDNVKTAYLLQYMRQCSLHIESLDKFKGGLEVVARTKGIKGVEEMLRKNDHTSDLKEFYTNFDSTFLRLFPDFIEEFNKLLKPECRVGLSKDGSMPNELRAFALIRLGITDSSKIAEFLRRSITTVYNYRVKMRNNAICQRDIFEIKVKEIMAAH